jgi:uncharacterized membrane protein
VKLKTKLYLTAVVLFVLACVFLTLSAYVLTFGALQYVDGVYTFIYPYDEYHVVFLFAAAATFIVCISAGIAGRIKGKSEVD